MTSFKNASVSSIDAGGSRGTSCTVDPCAPTNAMSWCCAPTFDPGSNAAAPSSAEDEWGLGVSMGD
jgi:hypothetical protein